MDSNVLFKDNSLEALSHTCSVNNKEVITLFKVIVKCDVLRVLSTAYEKGEKSLRI